MKKLLALVFGIALAGCQSNNVYSPLVVDANQSSLYSKPVVRPSNQTRALEQTNNKSVVSKADSGDSYTVVKGDTLYSIAFRYGKDYRSLASLNGIDEPYNIEVGQVINLSEASVATANKSKPISDSNNYYTVKAGDSARSIARAHDMSLDELVSQNHLQKPYNIYVGQKLKVSSTIPVAGTAAVAKTTPSSSQLKIVSGRTRTVAGISWMWPAKGKVIKRYSSSEHGNNGIDISGNRGQDVCAAAAGQVVYAGNALRGYGNLIIINHENEYLSAYAHNESLQVKEGQNVKRGQVIAKMGSTDAQSVRLHFEIRKKGNSVNPENYLPK